MPKILAVDPVALGRPGRLAFPDIPLRAYDRPLSKEREIRGDAALCEVLRHMLIVREFETMLAAFKAKGAYGDIAYAYKGPAHLSIGQEGAAVGQALALRPEDYIFGSHRSHGEFIAKGLSAIQRLAPERLVAILEAHAQGGPLRTVERHLPHPSLTGL